MTSFSSAGSFIALLLICIGTSCKKNSKDDPTPVVHEPIAIDCNYFDNNPNAVLKDDPDAPVDYLVSCKAQLRDDVQIEAGTVIAFEKDAGFIVREPSGSLAVNGSSTKPVVMTGVQKSRGSWAGIMIYSPSSKNKFQNLVVEYAGGDSFNSNEDFGAIIVYNGANLELRNSVIRESKKYGLNVSYNNSKILMENNKFSKNAIPVVLRTYLLGSALPSNDYSGNDQDFVELTYNTTALSNTTTLKKINVPYRFTQGKGVTEFQIRAALSIEAGNIIEMDKDIWWKVFKDGSLTIAGTKEDSVFIRGVQRSSGYWKNIYFEYAPVPNSIVYAHISDAGADAANSKGAIYMWAKPSVNVGNTKFSNISTCVFYAAPYSSNPNDNLHQSGLEFENTGGSFCGD